VRQIEINQLAKAQQQVRQQPSGKRTRFAAAAAVEVVSADELRAVHVNVSNNAVSAAHPSAGIEANARPAVRLGADLKYDNSRCSAHSKDSLLPLLTCIAMTPVLGYGVHHRVKTSGPTSTCRESTV
jgi:hypothetical protein